MPSPENSNTTRVNPSCAAARIPVSARALAGSSERTGGNPSTLDIQLSALIGRVPSSPGSAAGASLVGADSDGVGEWEAPDEAGAD